MYSCPDQEICRPLYVNEGVLIGTAICRNNQINVYPETYILSLSNVKSIFLYPKYSGNVIVVGMYPVAKLRELIFPFFEEL